MNAIPCLTWVKRGASKRNPERLMLTDDEIHKLVHSSGGTYSDPSNEEQNNSTDDDNDSEIDDLQVREGQKISKVPGSDSDEVERNNEVACDSEDWETDSENPESESTSENDDELNGEDGKTDSESEEEADKEIDDKYGMDDYDEDVGGSLNMAGLAEFSNNKKDPYILENDNDSDDDDMQILPDDNLVIVAKVKKGFCNMEAFVYTEKEQNCWCHHDLPLESIPLCMEWLDFDPGEDSPGNFMAMGTVKPDIELWDLDVVDSLEPTFILAGTEKKKSKPKRKKMNQPKGHSDAVLDLSWNRLQRSVLASASADFLVGIWDLTSGKMVTSLSHHQEKVQTLEWHPVETETLLSGSFDQTVKVYDCRNPETHNSWSLPGEVERVLWNKHNPYYFYASCDNGHVYYYDVRNEKPVFTLQSHESAVTGLALSKEIPNCFATVSSDKSFKIWKVNDNKPKHVWSKDLRMGQLHCVQGSPDTDLIFAVGGESELRVLNLKKNPSVMSEFGVKKDIDVPENFSEEITAQGMDSDESVTDDETVSQNQLPQKQHKKSKIKKKV